VHELIVGDEDADVRRAAGDGVKEHQVARLQIVQLDLLSHLELLVDLARQRHAVVREHPLREAAAVEAAGIAAAVAVRRAAEAQGSGDQRPSWLGLGYRDGGRRRRGRSGRQGKGLRLQIPPRGAGAGQAGGRQDHGDAQPFTLLHHSPEAIGVSDDSR